MLAFGTQVVHEEMNRMVSNHKIGDTPSRKSGGYTQLLCLELRFQVERSNVRAWVLVDSNHVGNPRSRVRYPAAVVISC